ncbi:MAG: hypothetical protein V1892_01365 [bacterium]
MKKRYLIISSLIIFSLVLSQPLLAATNDFTADANITVTGVTMGSGTVDMIIKSGSTAESWSFDGGTFTVTNPGSFLVGSSDSSVGVININRGGGLVECGANTTPGTTSVTLPTTAGVYTISPSTSTSCSSSLCSTLANAATYNSYPTCGAASCNSGYRVFGSGASATCVMIGGGGGGGGTSSGSGSGNTITINSGQTSSLGTVSSGGVNLFIYINSQANFTITVSSGKTESHSLKVNQIEIEKKQIWLVFESQPVIIKLTAGQTKLVDLDGDGVNDIKVIFNQLAVNKIDLTVKTTKPKIEGSGDLVRLNCATCKTVYYIGNDGKRYVFPNDKVYRAWYNDFSKVKVIASGELNQYPIGGNVTYRPGIKMVKIQTDPKVYAIGKSGVLRWVKTESIAQELYGQNWNTMIDDISPLFFVNYKMGEEIASTANYDKDSATIDSADINIDKDLF